MTEQLATISEVGRDHLRLIHNLRSTEDISPELGHWNAPFQVRVAGTDAPSIDLASQKFPGAAQRWLADTTGECQSVRLPFSLATGTSFENSPFADEAIESDLLLRIETNWICLELETTDSTRSIEAIAESFGAADLFGV